MVLESGRKGIIFYFTTTFIFAVFPLPVFTVITAFPFALARSFPVLEFTTTTFLFEELNLTVSVQPPGLSFTFAVAVVPFFMERELFTNFTPDASM